MDSRVSSELLELSPSCSSFTNGPACLGWALAWGKVRRAAFLPREPQAGCPNSLGLPLEDLPRGPGPWKLSRCPGEGDHALLQARTSGVAQMCCRSAALPNSPGSCPCPAKPGHRDGTQGGHSFYFSPTCPSGHHGAANADEAPALHHHQAIPSPLTAMMWVRPSCPLCR